MHHLQRRVGELSRFQGFLVDREEMSNRNVDGLEGERFCKGIVQLKFNAWSYMDSNLWAGLVHSIFEKLNEYITDSTKSGVAKLLVEEKLTESLQSLHILKQTEENRKQQLERLKKGYEKEKGQLKVRISRKIGQNILALNGSNSRLKKEFDELYSENPQFGQLLKVEGLTVLLDEYKLWDGFVRNLRFVITRPMYFIMAVIGILVAGAFMISGIDFGFNKYAGSVLAFIAGFSPTGFSAVNWYVKNRKSINQFLTKFNQVVDDTRQLDELVKGLESEIELIEGQQKLAEIKINDLSKKIKKVEEDMTSNLTQEAIHNFIGSRAEHKEYKDHLGIISIIRKDFETLSELFLEENTKSEPFLQDKQNLVAQENRQILIENKKVIKEQFSEGKKLERIVLYIDDLDRCSDEKVLEVLQAVHLLMAFPLFVVVVGVDKRCVNNALNYKNIMQYQRATGVEDLNLLKDNFDIQIIHPNEYLEKIFQIPFQIPEAVPDKIKDLIEELLKGQVRSVQEAEEQDEEEQFEEAAAGDAEGLLGEEDGDEVGLRDENEQLLDVADTQEMYNEEAVGEVDEEPEPEVAPNDNTMQQNLVDSAPDLRLTEEEKENLKSLSVLVGTTPRTIKRYVNLYRILRAHSGLQFNGLSNEQKLGVMFLLAMRIGDNRDDAFEFLKEANSKNKEENLRALISETKCSKTYKLLVDNQLEYIFDLKCGDVTVNSNFVKRFSFTESLTGTNKLKETTGNGG
ncbi:MAG: hypothetical protein GC178_11590 [Flavobacteriales bacterium]|nr:hypothetical protein [Flavobacteriales bacterium]